MRRASSILSDMVLGVCVLLLVAVLLAPSVLNITFNTILSGSMEPAIETGAMVAARNIAPEKVQVGDIISFRVNEIDIPVCHRVIDIVEIGEEFVFITKGDANKTEDPWIVAPENLIGKIVFHISWIGYISHFIKKPYGFGLLIGLPALIIIILEIKNILNPRTVMNKRPRLIERSAKHPAFLSLIFGLMLIGVLGGMMLGNFQERTLGSFAPLSEKDSQPVYTSERIMKNEGIFSLIICFYSRDKTVSFSEEYFRLPPGQQKTVEITGNYENAAVITGGFFPIFPNKLAHRLFTWNWQLSPFVVTAVWILPITTIAFICLIKLNTKLKLAKRKKLFKRSLSYE